MSSTEISLLSLVLTVRPAQAGPLPPVGRAAHALLLDAVRQSDPALAQTLHDSSELRPFTASNLIGYSPAAGLRPERTYTLRLTALTAPVSGALLTAAAAGGSLAPGAALRLAEAPFGVEAADWGLGEAPHPWAKTGDYETLSAPWLLGRAQPAPRLTLQFASPTTFKSGGLHVPAPLPGLVFGSLREKWNAFAPVALPEEVRRYAEECLALSAYRLHTLATPLKEGGLRVGAVGQARYTAVNPDRYWLSLVHLLADFAFYAGVGAGTTTGLGQCRRLAESVQG